MPPAYCGLEASWSCTRAWRTVCSRRRSMLSIVLVGIGVAHELGIEVERVIGRLERPAEVVHGEDVFQELGLLEVTDAAGLARGIELVRHGVGARVEVVIVARLVDAHAPQDDGRVVPVAADHAARRCPRRCPARADRRYAASRGSPRAPAGRSRRRRRGSGATAGSARCGRCCTSGSCAG